MDTSSYRTPALTNFELENQPAFNVVIVYEDFAAGKHAKETYDYLVHQLGHDYEFNNQMWKFDVLSNAKMKDMAVKDAMQADLIIISSHGVGDLPSEVKSWIEQWMGQKSRAKGLAVLVDRPVGHEQPASDAISSYLQDVACRADMDFFAQPDEWPDQDDDFSVQQVSERTDRTSTIMADFIQNHTPALPAPAFIPPPRVSYLRWGIND